MKLCFRLQVVLTRLLFVLFFISMVAGQSLFPLAVQAQDSGLQMNGKGSRVNPAEIVFGSLIAVMGFTFFLIQDADTPEKVPAWTCRRLLSAIHLSQADLDFLKDAKISLEQAGVKGKWNPKALIYSLDRLHRTSDYIPGLENMRYHFIRKGIPALMLSAGVFMILNGSDMTPFPAMGVSGASDVGQQAIQEKTSKAYIVFPILDRYKLQSTIVK